GIGIDQVLAGDGELVGGLAEVGEALRTVQRENRPRRGGDLQGRPSQAQRKVAGWDVAGIGYRRVERDGFKVRFQIRQDGTVVGRADLVLDVFTASDFEGFVSGFDLAQLTVVPVAV